MVSTSRTRPSGSGPVDIVFVMGWTTHIELMWKEPTLARFLSRLAAFSRLIVFDKRGTGLSDRVPDDRLPSLEVRMDDARAVMDAVGSERAIVMGFSEGGPMATLFAATYPERTDRPRPVRDQRMLETDGRLPVPRPHRRASMSDYIEEIETDVGDAGVRGARATRLGRAHARERRPHDRLARGLPSSRRESRSCDRARADEPRDRYPSRRCRRSTCRRSCSPATATSCGAPRRRSGWRSDPRRTLRTRSPASTTSSGRGPG